jgi:predicted TPR repeat methyltransferase
LKTTSFSQDHIKEHYDNEASHYDQIYLNLGYHDPLQCALLADKHLPKENRDEAEILDMGCGTGLVGAYLKEKGGFTKIVGVDASSGMLSESDKKGVYHELKELFLGTPDTFPDELRNRFSAITAAGILAEGHLGPDVFDEMVLALKHGGYAIFTTRTMYLTKYRY